MSDNGVTLTEIPDDVSVSEEAAPELSLLELYAGFAMIGLLTRYGPERFDPQQCWAIARSMIGVVK